MDNNKNAQMYVTGTNFYWHSKPLRGLTTRIEEELIEGISNFFDEHYLGNQDGSTNPKIFTEDDLCNYLDYHINGSDGSGYILDKELIRLCVKDTLIESIAMGFVKSVIDKNLPRKGCYLDNGNNERYFLSDAMIANLWIKDNLTSPNIKAYFEMYLQIRPEHLIPVMKLGDRNVFYQVSPSHPFYSLTFKGMRRDKGKELLLYVFPDEAEWCSSVFYEHPQFISEVFERISPTDEVSHAYFRQRQLSGNLYHSQDYTKDGLEQFNVAFFHRYVLWNNQLAK